MSHSHSYAHLAQYYDRLMDQDYDAWCDYLVSLWKRSGIEPSRILDVGCGTGNITIRLAQRGYEMTGVDLSPEMVLEARTKAEELGLEIGFRVQDMRDMKLDTAPYDAAVSACDAMNYLVEPESLVQAFAAVHRQLRAGGLFLFDLNSEYKLREIYGNQAFADIFEDFAYFWDNSYDEYGGTCRMVLAFFIREEQGLYRKVVESHVEKLWFPDEIRAAAEGVGFEIVGYYGFQTYNTPADDCERWQFVARKKQ